ncbi:MAG: DUF1275 family protein [Sphingomonadales bacterium]|nr:DUF1275 family protein [Sphingomonadales bacterium]
MSGNTTRAGVGLPFGWAETTMALSLIAAFVGGTVVGSLLGRMGWKSRESVILWSIAALLACACLAFGAGATYFALLLTAAAMGTENTIFEEDGEVTIGLTYMTGTLVKSGQRIAGALAGGPKWDWVPYMLLWISLLGGSIAGAFAHNCAGIYSLWGAAVVAAVLPGQARWVR